MTSVTKSLGRVATVRIAPVERWCEPMRGEYQLRPLPQLIGMVVAINTISMRTGKQCVNRCETREWKIEPSPALELRESVGIGPAVDSVWICEHMLEMD